MLCDFDGVMSVCFKCSHLFFIENSDQMSLVLGRIGLSLLNDEDGDDLSLFFLLQPDGISRQLLVHLR